MKKISFFVLFISVFVPFLAKAAAPTNGLVGHWRLDSGSGSSVLDSSGSSNNGNLLNSASWNQGKLNGGVNLDGTDDYLDMGDLPVYESSNFTISVWVKRNGAQADWVRIFNKGNAGGAPWGSYKLEFNNTSDTILNLHLGFTDGSAALVQSKTPLADGVWTNYTATYDGNTLKLYVNGSQEGNLNVAGKSLLYDAVPLTFGGYNGFGYFKGSMDEIRYYNRALSTQEVADLYISENTVSPSIEVYPGPSRDQYKSSLYTVEINDGVNWVPAYVYGYADKSVGHWHIGQNPSVNFLTFGTSGQVNVRISKIGGSITSAQVSPKSKNIPTQISNGQAIVTLNQNNKTWITINGDDANPLFIFADAPKPQVPAGATYFGPGVHTLAPNTNNHYYPNNNEVIYLDGGAWVKGNIDSRGKTGIQIMGPGVLSGEIWDPAVIQKIGWDSGFRDYFMIIASDYGLVGDTTIKGITIIDSPVYNIYNAKSVYSTKVLSPWYFQTDAYNAVDVDNVFAFNGDTTFNAYMGYWNPLTSRYDINTKVTNSFGGTANNAVILGGFYGNTPNVSFSTLVDNLDIKTYNDNSFVQYGSPHEPSVFQVWVDNNDSTYGYKNQTYQNIRIEGNVNAPLMQLMNRVYPASWGGNTYSAKGNSYNIKFKNISLEGQQLDGNIGKKSEIKGLDANNGFHDILLENVSIGGTVINQSNISNYIEVNPYVWGLSFSPVPTVTILANPTNINSGAGSTITWFSNNSTSCTASGAWSGAKSTSGTQVVNPVSSSTYILTCGDGVKTASSSVQINVINSQNSAIGFWQLDEGSGTNTYDSSGNTYTGALINGPVWAVGKKGGALSFDGVDDQVKISSATSLSGLSDMTLSAWINPRSFGGNGTGQGRILGKSDNASTARFALMLGTDGTSIQFNSGFDSVGGSWKTPTGSVPLNSWSHIALVYTHDLASTPTIYINGVAQAVSLIGAPSGNAVPDDSSFYIGSRGINNARVFDGLIDQVRIYNRKLASSEVTTIYNSENSGSSDITPPNISITSPLVGSTVSGNSVPLSANVTDNVGVVGVRFILGTTTNWSEDTTSPYGMIWNSTTVNNGSYTLTVTARDLSGNFSTSTVLFNVNNSAKEKFAIGNKVKTTARVNVRFTANGKSIGTQKANAQGTVTSGPTTAGGIKWWKVNFNSGTDGWVAENYLALVSIATAPIQSSLSVGSTGEEVATLQSLLKKLGYYTNGITGYFGQLTQGAVKEFQTANSIEAVGIVGPKTRAALDSLNQN